MKPPEKMNRREAIAIVLDLHEKRLRRTLVAITYQMYEDEGLTKETFEEILDVARG